MTGKLTFISAGAGSGKTHRLTQILHEQLSSGSVRPSGVVATTFTKKAATELALASQELGVRIVRAVDDDGAVPGQAVGILQAVEQDVRTLLRAPAGAGRGIGPDR